jgi:alginate O-acetyltransferase complex protein AlgI
MSFNSVVFIFGFLPAALLGYYILALTRLHVLRLPFLIVATLAFYARGSAHFLPLLFGSVAFNYLCGLLITRLPQPWSRLALWVGVSANVAALLWFKYANFLVDSLSAAFGLDVELGRIALPLAISFYTFQQIAHLVDLSRGRIEQPRIVDYFAFILFFPQLLAGPISLSREMIPQLRERPVARRVLGNILAGLLIFGIGLFKKTVIADSFALWTGPMFDAAAKGETPSFLAAWGGVLAYTNQVYFDFSGYSDMAIGVARMFGILLPLNFHSPLRAHSIADLWRRWHITLGRFVQSYIYQPLAVPLTRLAANMRLGKGGTLAVATLIPSFVSMVIIGAWHGASWTFVLFGAMHGSFMVINEIWNFVMKARRKKKAKGEKGAAMPKREIPWGIPLTFLCFALAIVPFRSADLPTTGRIFSAMAGASGASPWEQWPVLTPLGAWGLFPLIAFGIAIIWALPNTQQIMTRVTPVLEWARWQKIGVAPVRVEWRPAAVPTLIAGAVLMLGIIFVARGSTQFVYFAF